MHPKDLEEPQSPTGIVKGKKNKIMKVGGFQDKWVQYLPWVKSIIGNKVDVHEVHCEICSKEVKEQVFVPNSITC